MLGCTDHFEDINQPQGASVRVSPSPVFTRALVTGSGMSYTVWQLMHQTSSTAWVQHWANINPNFTGDNYEPMLGNSIWDFYYARQYFAPLNLNYQTRQLIQGEDNNPIQLACVDIWNVYMFHILTDGYGDIPYFEAIRELKPKFDSQETIYKDMLKTLAEAVHDLKTYKGQGYSTFGSADVLYRGDIDKWVKFANSLTLRLGLRVSSVAPDLGRKYIETIDLTEVMTTNAESALLLTETKNNAVAHEVKNVQGFVHSWNEVRISKTLMDHLDGTVYGGVLDPRIYQFADSTKSKTGYKGLANGQSSESLGGDPNYFKDNFSNIGPYFNTQDYEVPIFLLTNSETQFLLSEAAWRGWLQGGKSAEEYYQAGIKASMEQYRTYWNGKEAISAADEAAYLAAPGVTYDVSKALEQIITQKWIALYGNGQEAWSEMRRTGFPAISPVVDPFPGNTEMPRRRLHSSAEVSYNSENYKAAVARMGGDTQYTRVWWDGGK